MLENTIEVILCNTNARVQAANAPETEIEQ